MKRFLLALLSLMLLSVALACPALAEGSGWYMVDSHDPEGYCYLYSAASDRAELSYNKGPQYNGEIVYVMDYYGGQDGRFNYCYVQTQSGEEGYVHDYALVRYYGDPFIHSPGWYMVDSHDPQGYCYLYSSASDRSAKSYNKGPHYNGEMVYVLDYFGGRDGGNNYCKVETQSGETGYMHDYALVRWEGALPEDRPEGWYMVVSYDPMGYCYLYSAASDRDEISYNKGPLENGNLVYVMDYYGGQDSGNNYCYVRTMDGETGYIHDYALTHYLTYLEQVVGE